MLETLKFHGRVLSRGFWLYVWEVRPPKGPHLHYVGRTGDSSSINAQSPFNRMGQHLGFAKNSNMLRKYLLERRVKPETCEFRLISHGPVLKETKRKAEFRRRRDIVAALERDLERGLTSAGYVVLNRVKCRKRPQANRLAKVLKAFTREFPKLASLKRP